MLGYNLLYVYIRYTVDDNIYLKNTIERDSTKSTDEALIEIYEKLRPGEPATLEGATSLLYTRFFDPKRYDLAKAGRFKFKKKLSLLDIINENLEKVVDGSKFDEIIEDISKWGKILMIKITPSFVI